MFHLNGDLLCVISCRTTGLDPYIHSIWQFTCQPLDFRLEPHQTISAFDVMIQPTDSRYDTSSVSGNNFSKAMTSGLPPETVGILFHEWYERLNLSFNKQITVLAYDWPLSRAFVNTLFGQDNFTYYFNPRYRDVTPLAHGVVDACDRSADTLPFTHFNLRRLATNLEIEWDDLTTSSTLYEAYKIAEVYKHIIQRVRFI